MRLLISDGVVKDGLNPFTEGTYSEQFIEKFAQRFRAVLIPLLREPILSHFHGIVDASGFLKSLNPFTEGTYSEENYKR